MQAKRTNIETSDGTMPAYCVHPNGKKPAPLVILYMDALGLREELEVMADRMAAAGYYVVLPNLFYRDGGPSFDPDLLPDYVDPEMERLNVETTMAMVAADTRAIMQFAQNHPLALADHAGAIGYCMGGRHAVTAAASFPRQIHAAASIHGGRLVSDAPDSAHQRIREAGAEFYFGFADRDAAAPAQHLAVVRDELERHNVAGRAEIHHNALHGFAFPTRFCYHEAASEQCWTHWFDMLARNLAPVSEDQSPA